MSPNFSEDEVDDVLYLARIGDADFHSTVSQLCERESITTRDLLMMVKDPESGNGPLHMAAANGHAEILTTAIKYLSIGVFGLSFQDETQLAILNMQNEAGNTALHWAALNGHLDCVKVLVDTGADPTIKNKAGHDAVYEAELNNKTEVVEWVLKEGGEGLEEGIANEVEETEGKEGDVEDSDMAEVDGKEERSKLGVEDVENGMRHLQTEDKST